MKGKVSMKQMEAIEIDVHLTEKDDTDVLVFMLDEENPDMYLVNFNSPSAQAELKNVFVKLLEILTTKDITLKLSVEDGYNRGLYKDVCSEYINDLNREILQVIPTIREIVN